MFRQSFCMSSQQPACFAVVLKTNCMIVRHTRNQGSRNRGHHNFTTQTTWQVIFGHCLWLPVYLVISEKAIKYWGAHKKITKRTTYPEGKKYFDILGCHHEENVISQTVFFFPPLFVMTATAWFFSWQKQGVVGFLLCRWVTLFKWFSVYEHHLIYLRPSVSVSVTACIQHTNSSRRIYCQ